MSVYFEELGGGPTVIVAHGALGSVATASLRAIDLAKHGFRVIAYDARGHGRSGFSENPHDYRRDARADDLLGLMDHLGIAAASIVGTSMGACTALTLARRDPGRITRLVLRSPSPFPGDDRTARRSLTGLALAYQWLGVAATSRLGALGAPAATRQRFHTMLANQRRAAVVPMLRGVLSESLYPPGLADITVPALVLAHPDDAIHPVTSAQALRAQLPNAQLLMSPSRTQWEEQPDQLVSAIAAFLTATKP
jgi:3-oxoadipate enol-lactonase